MLDYGIKEDSKFLTRKLTVWSYLMHDLEEVKLARRLGVVIESELLKGEKLPDEVMRAFKELLAHWQWQMQRDWS